MEKAGIPTLTMSVGLDITRLVRPPRAVFVNFPMGNETGRPGMVEEQREIVRGAFAAVESMTEAGSVVELPLELVADGPDGEPWQDWVYTVEFRDRLMSTRE
ncbi:MAG: hypothetical protein ACE5E4_09800 [Candidatus Binatia bacterium]